MNPTTPTARPPRPLDPFRFRPDPARLAAAPIPWFGLALDRPAPKLPPWALDAGMFGGPLLAWTEPNWVGISALVGAVGAIVVKLRELDSGALRKQNAQQAEQIRVLTEAVDLILANGTRPTGPEAAPK